MTTQCPKCKAENPDESKFCNECGLQIDSIDQMPAPPTQTLEIPREELTTGSTFAGRYQIIEELGRGGMGRVYKATDTKIKEKVALKLIKPEIASDKKTLERFGNELRIARKITHKNVGKMFDINEEEGTHYITMEYVSGQDLKGLIRQSGQLAIGTSISVAKQVCEGLSEAHKTGVIHRDLKPSNIMIDREGNVRIMDFGIARSLKEKGITGAGVMIGTPEYMSPEQAEAKEVDQRSDIYSLGVILYEMVTGRVPFEGDTALSIAMRHKGEAPKDPKEYNAQILDDLSNLILKCLEKDKDSRFQRAGEIQSELENIEKGIPTTDRAIPKRKTITSKEITVTFGLRKLLVPALIFIGIVIVGIIIWQVLPQKEVSSSATDIGSIAVLSFDDLSPEGDQEYLCDGIAESILNALSRIKGLRVPGKSSSFSFKGKERNIQDVGDKLSVETVLEGSIQRLGNRIRITAQLIKVEDETLIWSEQYNRDEEDLFAIQDEIALSVAGKLRVRLLEDEQVQLTKRDTENPEAYQAYLKGLFYWNKRTGEDLRKAVSHFENAIEKEPNYALAYVGMADCYNLLSFYSNVPPAESFPRAKQAALKAIALDETLGEAHNSLAYARCRYDWDLAEAEREFKKAIELNPRYATAHFWYAENLMMQGRFDEAFREMNLALEFDPVSLIINSSLGLFYNSAKQPEKAVQQGHKTLEMNANFAHSHGMLSAAYANLNKFSEAIAEGKKAIELSGGSSFYTSGLGWIYAMAGNTNEAKRILEELKELSNKQYVSPFHIAYIYVGLGENDKSFEWLEKAYEERYELLVWIKVNPAFDPIRTDPRFTELLKKIGL